MIKTSIMSMGKYIHWVVATVLATTGQHPVPGMMGVWATYDSTPALNRLKYIQRPDSWQTFTGWHLGHCGTQLELPKQHIATGHKNKMVEEKEAQCHWLNSILLWLMHLRAVRERAEEASENCVQHCVQNMSADIDIDIPDRDAVLKLIQHTAARQVSRRTSAQFWHLCHRHSSRSCNIGCAAIDYETAEQRGYFKIDLLNMSVYQLDPNIQNTTKPCWQQLLRGQSTVV